MPQVGLKPGSSAHQRYVSIIQAGPPARGAPPMQIREQSETWRGRGRGRGQVLTKSPN